MRSRDYSGRGRMMLLIPYEVRTMFQRSPWANLGILVVTIVTFLLIVLELVPREAIESMVLYDADPRGMLGHMLLHAGWLHLIGNMVLLFVFGNAVCGVMNNFLYLGVYIAMGIAAAVLHLMLDGSPAIGASGALCGVMGMYLAIYPVNQINCFWLFLFRAGTFGIPGWVLILLWFILDLVGAMDGGGDVAHWAHIGGTLAGFGVGVLLLKLGKIDLYDYDNPTVLDLLPSGVARGES